MNITWKGSPNFWKNRTLNGKKYQIKKIVMHWFGAGTLESANSKFQDPSKQSSAHYGISKGRVWQWVRELDAAWHSGVGLVNLESIGIEHDANPNQPLSDLDYKVSAELLADISRRTGLPLNRSTVIKHSEVKATQCCGTIDLDRIIRDANYLLKPPMNINYTRFIVANKVEPEKRAAFEKEVADADEWFALVSGGRDIVKSTIHYVEYNNIPMGDYGALSADGKIRIAAPEVNWYDENVTRLAHERGGFDECLFYEEAMENEWITSTQTTETIQGLMFFNSPKYPRMQRTMVQANLGASLPVNNYKNLGLASIIIMHETSHAQFWLYTGDDPTHALFYTENMKDAPLIFERLNFELLTQALERRRASAPPPTPEPNDMKFLRINQNGKQGVMVLENLSGTILFENDWAEYQTLLNITNGLSLNSPVVNVPAGRFFRLNDHGKLGIMVLDGFAGTALFESDWNDYQKLLQISGMSMSTPEISLP